jgi:hypothetical protein
MEAFLFGIRKGVPPFRLTSCAFSLQALALSEQTSPILPCIRFKSVLKRGESCLMADVSVQE